MTHLLVAQVKKPVGPDYNTSIIVYKVVSSEEFGTEHTELIAFEVLPNRLKQTIKQANKFASDYCYFNDICKLVTKVQKV